MFGKHKPKPDSINPDPIDNFFIRDRKKRLAMVNTYTNQIMDFVASAFVSSHEFKEFVQKHYQSSELDILTLATIKFDLQPFIDKNLENFLFVSSLGKGNEKLTHQLSEILQPKYVINNEDLNMLFSQFILDKKLSSSYRSESSFGK